MTSRTSQTTTHTLDVPGATLTYDVRRNDATTEPILLLIGWPMGAGGFGTLSRHFSDRTVVTYDPRGVERSATADPTSPVTPDIHADDLHRLIQAIGGGPVDLFASSGGAVNALALVSKHPGDVRTLVAHEPPLASILPDREHAMAATQAVQETYQRSGWGAGMAQFIVLSSHQGPFTAEIAGQPAPDPAMFGMPTEDDGSRTDPLLSQNLVTSHPLRARLRRPAVRLDTDRPGRRGGVRGPDGESWRLRRRRAAWHRAGDVPEQSRWLPRRRVRPVRPARGLRGKLHEVLSAEA